MILFKSEHVAAILAGEKTQTRRFGKRRWNVGAVHQCATRLFDRDAVFARVQILRVREEQLVAISHEDVRAEGYDSGPEYLAAFQRINGIRWLDGSEVVWVVEFRLIEKVLAA